MEKQIKNTEAILKKHLVIKQDATIEDLFLLPYDKIFYKLEMCFIELRNYFKPIPNEQNDRLFFYVLSLINFSESFFYVQKTSENSKVKTNIKQIEKFINKLIIEELSPYILSFFYWDFNRRIWKNYNNGYKTEYITSVISEIDNEIKGNKKILLNKYIELLVEFFIEKFDNVLNDYHKIQQEDLVVSEDEAFTIRNQFSELIENNRLNKFIDDDLKTKFSDFYKSIAKNYIEGINKSNSRYSYLLYSLVDAQSQYKLFLENHLKITENIDKLPISDLRNALLQKNIIFFIKKLNTYFASVPNVLIKNANEAFYHIYIHLILKLLGFDIESEVQTNVGRIDAVIKIENYIYIIEFKISSAEKAMEQIESRKYYQKFMIENKEILLLGISFDNKLMIINEKYELKEVK